MRLVKEDSESRLPRDTPATSLRRWHRAVIALVALTLFALLVAMLRLVFDSDRSDGADEVMLAAPLEQRGMDPVTHAVSTFTVFTLEQSATRGSEFNSAYVRDGLRLFAAVVEAFLARDSIVRGSYAAAPRRMRAEAERLGVEAASARPTIATRAAFVSAAEAIAVVQRRRFPHLEQAIAGLRDAARSIRLNRPLAEQRAEVETFFLRASDTVQGMMTVQL